MATFQYDPLAVLSLRTLLSRLSMKRIIFMYYSVWTSLDQKFTLMHLLQCFPLMLVQASA